MLTGIDVSRWQGAIDWDATRGSIDFAIIKAGGSDDGLYEDSQFVVNRQACLDRGIPHGFYYFVGGGNPTVEADHFKSIVGDLRPAEIVVLDFEIDHADPAGYCLTFLERCELNFGVKPFIYLSQGRCAGMDALTGYPLWMAGYFDNTPDHPEYYDPSPWPAWNIWQYSSTGSVPGIEGNVDMNVATGWPVSGTTNQGDDDMGWRASRMESTDGDGKEWDAHFDTSIYKESQVAIIVHAEKDPGVPFPFDHVHATILFDPTHTGAGWRGAWQGDIPVGTDFGWPIKDYTGQVRVILDQANATYCERRELS